MSKPKTGRLGDFTPDPANLNKGTERGAYMLETSLQRFGAGRSIVVDRDGVILAGNKTAEQAGALGLEDVVVVQTDGTKVVVVQRMDMALSDPETRERAQGLAIADNRAGEVGLAWDGAGLASLLNEGADLSAFWREDELAGIMTAEVPDFAPVGEDEQGRLDQKKPVTCPECGHEFIPKG